MPTGCEFVFKHWAENIMQIIVIEFNPTFCTKGMSMKNYFVVSGENDGKTCQLFQMNRGEKGKGEVEMVPLNFYNNRE